MKSLPLSLVGSFLAFSDSKNMIEAAKLVGLSQPSLTNHLKQFESYFSKEIFALEGRRKVLTPFGKRLNEMLKNRFENLDRDIKSIAHEFERPEYITIRVAGRSEILCLLAKQIRFQGQLVFLDTDGASAVSALEDREYDIAISNHVKHNSFLHSKKLFSDQFAILAPKSYLSGEQQISKTLIEKLVERPYLSYSRSDERLNSLLKVYKMESHPSFSKVISNWDTLIEMVGLQQGWAIAPTRFSYEKQKAFRILIPKSVISGTDFFAFYRKESVSMPWFKDLINQFKAESV